jgi:hypothetical protein
LAASSIFWCFEISEFCTRTEFCISLLSAPDRAAEPFAAYSHATVRQPRVRVRAHTLDDGVLSEWVFRRCEHVHDENGTDKG